MIESAEIVNQLIQLKSTPAIFCSPWRRRRMITPNSRHIVCRSVSTNECHWLALGNDVPPTWLVLSWSTVRTAHCRTRTRPGQQCERVTDFSFLKHHQHEMKFAVYAIHPAISFAIVGISRRGRRTATRKTRKF